MVHLAPTNLTNTEKVFNSFHNFGSWLFGDPTSSTFATRKTLIEAMLGIMGFIVVSSLVKRLNIL